MPLTKVSSGVIAANAVVDSFGTQSITGDKLGLTAINANNIVNASITGAKIALGTITGDDIATGQITGNLLTANCVSGNNIVDGLITSEKINTSIFDTTSNIFGVSANSNTFSNTIIIVSGNTAPINVGMLVTGSNVTPGTTVLSFNSSPPSGRSNITLSAATVGTNTNTTFSFYETNKVLSPGIAGPGLCKAWVNFNGTGSVQLRAAYNVSSIVDYGAMYYGINFVTAMPDTNYAITACGSNVNNDDGTNYTGYSLSTGNRTAAMFAIRGLNIFLNGANQLGDCAIVTCAVFR